MPDNKPTKGMTCWVVASSTNIDSSGESLDIKGCDLSTWEQGEGIVNIEHQSSHDPKMIVGVVVDCGKVFKKEDCRGVKLFENYWAKYETPFIIAKIRLATGCGNANADAIASIIRNQSANGEKSIWRVSIEGSTIKRDGNILVETTAKALSLTVRPANKVCDLVIDQDPDAPDGYKTEPKQKDILDQIFNKDLSKTLSVANNELELVEDLVKTTTAGNYNAAPGTLTGGASLQIEDASLRKEFLKNQIKSYLRDNKGLTKAELRGLLKHRLPDVSDDFLDYFVDTADELKVKKSTTLVCKLENLTIELKKALDQAVDANFKYSPPKAYKINVITDQGVPMRAGRFMIFDNNIYHLEDYFGHLNRLIPEGPIDHVIMDHLLDVKLHPNVQIVYDNPQFDSPESAAPENQGLYSGEAPPTKESIFEYIRNGVDEPQVIHFQDGQGFFNGLLLTDPELQTIFDNVNAGVAQIRYPKDAKDKAPVGGEAVQKADSLNKSEEDMSPDEALEHVRRAVKAGHIPASVEQAMTRHLYHDPMVPGLGNKRAAQQFAKQNKPGVYVSIDGNNLRNINNQLGHAAGDQAITHLGTAIRDAAAKVGNGHAARAGGDEFVTHFPTPEHAMQFVHHANELLNKTPLINGTHKVSASFGIGHDLESSDKALYGAKAQKTNPVTGLNNFGDHDHPNLAHSHLTGQSGPIHLPRESAAETVKGHAPTHQATA